MVFIGAKLVCEAMWAEDSQWQVKFSLLALPYVSLYFAITSRWSSFSVSRGMVPIESSKSIQVSPCFVKHKTFGLHCFYTTHESKVLLNRKDVCSRLRLATTWFTCMIFALCGYANIDKLCPLNAEPRNQV